MAGSLISSSSKQVKNKKYTRWLMAGSFGFGLFFIAGVEEPSAVCPLYEL